jgi:hypothetical protein
MNVSTTTTGKRRAPLVSYVLMILTGVAVSAAISAVAALSREDLQLLAAGVTMVTTLPITLSLGWVLLVSQHTVQPDPYAEDNVETRWFEQAASRTLLDVFATVGLATAVFAIADEAIQPEAWSVCMVLLLLVMADVAIRYTVLKRRGGAGADA